jgi:hypothetical protein
MKRLTFTFLITLLACTVTLRATAQSEQTRQVSGFDSLVSLGPFYIHVNIDGREGIKINAKASVMKDIETVVEAGTLKIKLREHGGGNDDHGPIDVYVSAKSLSSLKIANSGSIRVEGTLTGSDIKIDIEGAGFIWSSVKTNKLEVNINGSGTIFLDGIADEANVVIDGPGALKGQSLKAGAVTASIAGPGSVNIIANKTLSADIDGAGGVTYSGNAMITSNKTTGPGGITKAD